MNRGKLPALALQEGDQSIQRVVDFSKMFVLFEIPDKFPPVITEGISGSSPSWGLEVSVLTTLPRICIRIGNSGS